MSEFENVTIVKKANVYLDGKVTSRTILFPDGAKKSLGLLHPGEYELKAVDREVMDIMSGDMDVLLPGESEWQTVKGGDSFGIPAGEKFSMRVREITDELLGHEHA